MTRDPSPGAETAPAPVAASDWEAARALRNRALEEARAVVQEHLRRAEELRRAAVAAARELLDKEPVANALLASIEQGVLGAGAPGLDALEETMARVDADPLAAMDALMSERQRALDQALRGFMQVSSAPQSRPSAPASGAS